jgi:hypothetical protein
LQSADTAGVVAGKDYIVVKRTKMEGQPTAMSTMNISDKVVLSLLKRIRESNDQDEIRHLSDQLERAIFHRQYANT